MSAAPTLVLRLVSRTDARCVVHNDTEAAVRLWEPGNSWGDPAWWFELMGPQGQRQVRRQPQDYTRNVPSSREVAPGGSEPWHFDLGDGSWDFDAAADLSASELVAVYEAPPSAEAEQHGVLLGPLRSEPVDVP